MDHFNKLRKGTVGLLFLVLSLTFFAAALLPSYHLVLYGFLVGGTASVCNTLHLAWKVNLLGNAAAERNGRKAGLGYATRASIALLAGVIAYRFGFSMAGTAAGLFLAQWATLLLGIFTLRHRHMRESNEGPASDPEERGET